MDVEGKRHSFAASRDWKDSPCAQLVEEFGPPHSVLKIRGHFGRPDFLYLSDEPGYFTLFRWDPKLQAGAKIVPDTEPVTDSAASGDFMLHPQEPWIVTSRRRTGEKVHSLYLLDYRTGEARELAHAVGIVWYLIPFSAGVLMALVTAREETRLLAMGYDGRARVLFATEQQVLSMAASERHGAVALTLGRRTTEIAVINPHDGSILRRWSEAEGSREGCLTIEEGSGYLTYTSDAAGDGEEIVVRSLKSFDEVKRIPVPGSVGFFDLGYLEWVNDHELLAVVAQNGRVSPRLLDVGRASWSAPLAETSAVYATKTSQGIVWVASDFGCSEFVQSYRDGRVETVIPPSYENQALAVESHWYRSFDDRRVQGWLMRNVDHPKAPLVVMCHGGPTDAVTNEWGEPIVPLLVQAGYHLFQPNYRGSTTFGTEFRNLQTGDAGGGDLRDVLYGANHISKLLGLDTKPILMGFSYGGYLTLHGLTTQPAEWAGGVAIVPFADWEAHYRSADSHYRNYCVHFMGGTPEEEPERYRERSPINHVAHLAAPVLIVTGDDDSGYAEVKRFHDTAKANGKPVQLVVQKTGHGTSTVDQMNAEIVHSLDFLSTLDLSCG